MDSKKVVIGLSGGMDSSTLLAHYLEEECEIHCCIFRYGSKHNPYENQSADNLVAFYQAQCYRYQKNIKSYHFDLTHILGNYDSALLANTEEDIPEGHFEDEIMKRTVVPGRNLVMSSIMASLAEAVGADCIGLGVHAGDHFIYPDCREEFTKSLDTTIFLSTDGQVSVEAPFQKMMKQQILEFGLSLKPPVPYHLTRTCYKDQSIACGKCGACQERLEGFEKIHVEDPVRYE